MAKELQSLNVMSPVKLETFRAKLEILRPFYLRYDDAPA